MGMPVDFQAGPITYTDGGKGYATMNREGAVRVVQANGGRYAEACRLGQMFTYSTPAAGVAIPIYSATTQQCVLWNPLGSAKAMWIKQICFGYVSGTMVAGHLCLATQTLVVNSIAGTQSAIVNNNKIAGNYNASGQNGQNGQLLTAVTVVAFTYFRALRLSQFVPTAAAVAAPWIWNEDIDGGIILMPGGAIAIAANVAAAVTATVAVETVEAPVALAL